MWHAIRLKTLYYSQQTTGALFSLALVNKIIEVKITNSQECLSTPEMKMHDLFKGELTKNIQLWLKTFHMGQRIEWYNLQFPNIAPCPSKTQILIRSTINRDANIF